MGGKWRDVLTSQLTVWIVFAACVSVSSALLGIATFRSGGGNETDDLKEAFAFQVFLGQALMHSLACYFALISVLRHKGNIDRLIPFGWGKSPLEPARAGFYACILISVCTGIATPIVYRIAKSNKDAYATCLSFISMVFSAVASGLLAMKIVGKSN